MTNNIDTNKPRTILSSLPNTPLTESAIQTIQQHDAIAECIPLYETKQSPSGAVSVLFKHNERTVLTIFNPDETKWETVFKTETFSNVYGEDATDTRKTFKEKLDRIHELYESDEITLLNPAENNIFTLQETPFTNLLTGLPETPVSTETLQKFKNEPDVIEVIPHLYLQDTNNAVLLSITFDDVIDNERRFGFAFFDKDIKEWVGTFSMTAKRLNEPNNVELENAFETVFETVENAYRPHILGVIETEEDYREWIPGKPVQDKPKTKPR